MTTTFNIADKAEWESGDKAGSTIAGGGPGPINAGGGPASTIVIVEKNVVNEITTKRRSVYGPFLHNAMVAQALKQALRNLPDPDNEKRFDDLPLDVREGLDLIALKMSRIVTGDPEYLDNWDDIAGYATIVAKRIRGVK
jgi:hypothetical protein